jgi:hypothetical protein
MCGSPPQADYFLLKRALDAGARPRAVVLDLHPHLLRVGFWGTIRFWPNLLTAGESLEMAWTARDPDFAAQVILARALPSVLGRYDLRPAVMAALNGQTFSLRHATLNSLWNRRRNLGSMVLPQWPTPQFGLTPTDFDWYVPGDWKPKPLNTVYVRRFLKLAAEHDITVFLLIPPLDARLQQLREQRGLTAAFEQYVVGLQARHPNLVVVDGLHSKYPSSAFRDAQHVCKPGAVALSADLAEIIRPYLERQNDVTRLRWVALPAYHEHSTRVRVEDIAETDRLPLLSTRILR